VCVRERPGLDRRAVEKSNSWRGPAAACPILIRWPFFDITAIAGTVFQFVSGRGGASEDTLNECPRFRVYATAAGVIVIS
jgi:hypothetical protein